MNMANQTTDTSTTNFSNSYPTFFRRDAHLLLAFGYNQVKSSITDKMKEPEITIKLCREIQNKLESFDIPEEIYKRRYAVKAEDPLEEANEPTFLDIVVEETKGRPRARYIFEAKRLKKNGFSIGKYCKEGIKRFVQKKYARKYPEAAMIGFMQSDNVEYWFGELKRKFDEDKGEMCIDQSLIPCKVIPELQNEWKSTHFREAVENISLFHIFLETH
jgi:hypothetical protein